MKSAAYCFMLSALLCFQTNTAENSCSDDIPVVLNAIICELPDGWSLETSPDHRVRGSGACRSFSLYRGDILASVTVTCKGSVAAAEEIVSGVPWTTSDGSWTATPGIGEQGFVSSYAVICFRRDRFVVNVHLQSHANTALPESRQPNGKDGQRGLKVIDMQEYKRVLLELARKIDARVTATELAVAPEPAQPRLMAPARAVARAR
jgi:hypothetical protein